MSLGTFSTFGMNRKNEDEKAGRQLLEVAAYGSDILNKVWKVEYAQLVGTDLELNTSHDAADLESTATEPHWK